MDERGQSEQLVADPDRVAHEGIRQAVAHWAFYERLSPRLRAGDAAVVAQMEATLNAVMPLIDCTACGRCCAHMGPVVNDEEAGRLALALNVSRHELTRRHLRPMWPGATECEQVWLLPDPCSLHDGRLCTVYEARPQVCRDFPQAAGTNAAERLAVWVETARICPITFNTVERLMVLFNP